MAASKLETMGGPVAMPPGGLGVWTCASPATNRDTTAYEPARRPMTILPSVMVRGFAQNADLGVGPVFHRPIQKLGAACGKQARPLNPASARWRPARAAPWRCPDR